MAIHSFSIAWAIQSGESIWNRIKSNHWRKTRRKNINRWKKNSDITVHGFTVLINYTTYTNVSSSKRDSDFVIDLIKGRKKKSSEQLMMSWQRFEPERIGGRVSTFFSFLFFFPHSFNYCLWSLRFVWNRCIQERFVNDDENSFFLVTVLCHLVIGHLTSIRFYLWNFIGGRKLENRTMKTFEKRQQII